MNYLEIPIYKPYPLSVPLRRQMREHLLPERGHKRVGCVVRVMLEFATSTHLITTPPPSVLQLEFV